VTRDSAVAWRWIAVRDGRILGSRRTILRDPANTQDEQQDASRRQKGRDR